MALDDEVKSTVDSAISQTETLMAKMYVMSKHIAELMEEANGLHASVDPIRELVFTIWSDPSGGIPEGIHSKVVEIQEGFTNLMSRLDSAGEKAELQVMRVTESLHAWNEFYTHLQYQGF